MSGCGEVNFVSYTSHKDTKTQRRMRDSGGMNFVDLQSVAVHDERTGMKTEVR